MSAVLSPWFSVVLLLVCGSSEAGQNITAKPGENVTLTCIDEKNDELDVLEWIIESPEKKNVFVFRDGKPFAARQHKSYRNRVSLKDSQMKDGDLSVVLKNVTMKDNGTYQCRVLHKNDPQRDLNLISTIHLSVVPPGDPSPGQQGGLEGDQGGKNEERGSKKEGLIAGVIIGIVLLGVAAAVVAVVVLWIYRKKKGPNQSSSGSNNQQEIELNPLNTDSTAEKTTTNKKMKKKSFDSSSHTV